MNETPRIEAERIVTAWMESEDEPKSALIDSVAHALTVCRTETLREAARLADDAIVLESEGHSLGTLAQVRAMKAKIADNIRAVATSAVEGQALVQEFGPEHPLVVREHYHIDTFDHIAERVCVCDMKAATRVICAPCVNSVASAEQMGAAEMKRRCIEKVNECESQWLSGCKGENPSKELTWSHKADTAREIAAVLESLPAVEEAK